MLRYLYIFLIGGGGNRFNISTECLLARSLASACLAHEQNEEHEEAPHVRPEPDTPVHHRREEDGGGGVQPDVAHRLRQEVRPYAVRSCRAFSHHEAPLGREYSHAGLRFEREVNGGGGRGRVGFSADSREHWILVAAADVNRNLVGLKYVQVQ